MNFFWKRVGGREEGCKRGGKINYRNKFLYNFDNVYQFTEHWLLMYWEGMMQLFFTYVIFVYSVMVLLICKYEPFWQAVSVELLNTLLPEKACTFRCKNKIYTNCLVKLVNALLKLRLNYQRLCCREKPKLISHRYYLYMH